MRPVAGYLLHSPREAKSTHQSLKELLNSRELFDRDVDIQRKKQVFCHCFRRFTRLTTSIKSSKTLSESVTCAPVRKGIQGRRESLMDANVLSVYFFIQVKHRKA